MMIDRIIKACIALVAFIATAWHIYVGIVGFIEAKKNPDARWAIVTFSIIALLWAVLLAWSGAALIR